MKKDRKRNKSNEMIFDINRHWTLACFNYDETEIENFIYCLDRETYQLIQKRDLSDEEQSDFENLLGTRYVKLCQFIKETLYSSLIKIIDRPEVYNYFKSSQSLDEKYQKYDLFVEYNALDQYEHYRMYLEASRALVSWCEENDIKYKYIPFSKPQKYIYDDAKRMMSKNWELPCVQ